MKSSTMRMMIAAAALAVAAGVASAQTYKAEIPLAFRAGNKVMQPGAYDVRVSLGATGIASVTIQNRDANSTVLLVPTYGSDAPKRWREAGKPVFAFECAEGQCMLRTFWTGTDLPTYKFPGHIAPKSDKEVAELLVTLVKSE
ncbi:MAG TPA: hypothetical protein VKB88_29165 [Bryobacteraceae bacterium]|nr:hypothetical protein [Bryobacteraceae bacterium]